MNLDFTSTGQTQFNLRNKITGAGHRATRQTGRGVSSLNEVCRGHLLEQQSYGRAYVRRMRCAGQQVCEAVCFTMRRSRIFPRFPSFSFSIDAARPEADDVTLVRYLGIGHPPLSALDLTRHAEPFNTRMKQVWSRATFIRGDIQHVYQVLVDLTHSDAIALQCPITTHAWGPSAGSAGIGSSPSASTAA